MKLEHLLEAKRKIPESEKEIMNYFYSSFLLQHHQTEGQFRKFLQESEEQFKGLAFFETLGKGKQAEFNQAFGKDFKRIQIKPNGVNLEYKWNKDDISNAIYLTDVDKIAPPFQFLEVGYLIIRFTKPFEKLPSWLPRKARSISFQGSVKSCHNIHNIIHECTNIDFWNPIPTNLLGLTKIKGLHSCTFHNDFEEYNTTRNWELDNILKRFYNTDDIFECQEALINAGYKDQAKL